MATLLGFLGSFILLLCGIDLLVGGAERLLAAHRRGMERVRR